MDLPAEVPQHFLPQPVAIARRPGRVIRRAVALDAEDVPARLLRVRDGEVEMVAGHADLRMHLVTLRAQGARHLDLEVRFWLPRRGPGGDLVLLLREVQ